MRPNAFCLSLLFLLGFGLSPVLGASARPDLKSKGLMGMLTKSMLGHPVIAVGNGDYRAKDVVDEAVLAKAITFRDKLQVIADAASGDEDTKTLIPFAVRGAWVLAPQMREEPRTDFSGLTDMDVVGVDVLLDKALLSLTPAQRKEAGAANGVPVSRLPKVAREALARAIRPPYRVQRRTSVSAIDPKGGYTERFSYEALGRVFDPIDWSRVRLRAHLVMPGASIRIPTNRPDSYSVEYLGRRGDALPILSMMRQYWRVADVPVYDLVPNKFKPTDLDGRVLKQPIGIEGVFTVEEVLAQLRKVTGLRLGAMSRIEGAPVFVGSKEMTCGDVTDGMRLAITGTWRRVGSAYVMAWDKRGLLALRQTVAEGSRGLPKKATDFAEGVRENLTWIDVALQTPFAPDDPLALTDEQRRTFFGTPEDRSTGYRGDPQIPYAQMAPSQQAFLARAMQTEKRRRLLNEPGPDGPPRYEESPYTEADLQSAYLDSREVAVDMSLELPGTGWVSVGAGGSRPLHVDEARSAISHGAQAPPRNAPAPDQPALPRFEPKPMRLAANERAVMAPALDPAHVNELIDEMKRRGLDTLFYPALADGYATFPSRAFPLHPALRGQDGWAAAAKAAKAAGIKLVAYLSPVAWQSDAQGVHWLNRHKDWLDVDALGRTRLQYLAGHDPTVTGGFSWLLPHANYVRPTEPEVARRLGTLVDEVARLQVIAGLAVVDWRPARLPEGDDHNSSLPAMGFAMADRIAAVLATGSDPIDDDPSHVIYADQVWKDPDVLTYLLSYSERKEAPDPYAALATRVLQRAKAVRKGWTTYLVDEAFAEDRRKEDRDSFDPSAKPTVSDRPKADRVLSVMPAQKDTSYAGYTVPVPPRGVLSVSKTDPPDLASYPALAVLNYMMGSFAEGKPQAGIVVYDFRAIPGEIAASVAYIAK